MAIGLPITGSTSIFFRWFNFTENMIGIGLVLSMKYHHRSYMFELEDDFEH